MDEGASSPPTCEPRSPDFLAGGGEMGALMRALDWSRTPLGPVEAWPQSLRTSVSICLDCDFPILVWWGPELVMLYNDEYRPILGSAKHPAALGEGGAKVWPEIWNVIGPMLQQVMERGEAARARDLLLLMDRHGYTEETYFSFSYSPIRDESGGVGGVFCPVIETTEKVIGERRLRTLRDLAAQSIGANSAVEACRAAASVLAANPHDIPFAAIYHVDRDRNQARLAATAGIKPGTPASPEVIALQDGEACDGWPLASVARTGEVLVVSDLAERFGVLPGGAWPDPPCSAMLLPVILPGQEQAAAILVAAVSPRRALDDDFRSFFELAAGHVETAMAEALAYEAERQRAEALAEIDRTKTLFFSNVSHEFRTPLTLMLGPLEETLRRPSLAGKDREELTVSHRNGLRLLKLVNSLLDFSRVEAGRARAVYQAMDLAAFTADLASNFRSACERAGLRLTIDCPPLPEPVYVDRDMWEKIVLNLVSNAFKFTFDGEIAVAIRAEGGQAELTVRDTGTGIPEAELPRIFERFHRVEDARGRTHEGTGIGLALVQELVKLHGGTVRVASTSGAGTTFTVRVPLGTTHLPADRIGGARTQISTATRAGTYVEEALRWLPDSNDAAPELPSDAGLPVLAAGLDRPRVLLADDNADMRDYVRRLLAARYAVDAVADGRAALEAAQAHRPDLVLADVMMPRLDGFGLLRAVRADPALRDVPVMLLSARAGEEAEIEGLEAGADDYLVKPFSARDLLARIESNLKLAGLRQLANTELRASEERFRALVNASSDVVYRMSPDWSEMRQLVGRDFIADTEDPSRTWLDKYIYPDDQPHVMAVIAEAIRTKSVFELEHRVRRVDGSLGWTFSRAVPLLDEKGEITEWFGAASDVTARKQADEHLRLLLDELNHRVKNTLATVQSIAAQTLKGAAPLAEERQAFQDRLVALSKLHDLLTEDNWAGVGLREVVLGALAPYGVGESARFTVAGPNLHLKPKAALTLGMAAHELATNAAKYGALSNGTGHVRVAWNVEPSPEPGRLRLRWSESGGPPVETPRRKGFGSLMIQRGLTHDLDSNVRHLFEPGGVVCAIDMPLSVAGAEK